MILFIKQLANHCVQRIVFKFYVLYLLCSLPHNYFKYGIIKNANNKKLNIFSKMSIFGMYNYLLKNVFYYKLNINHLILKFHIIQYF